MKKFTKTLLIAAASLTLGLASCRASANNSPNTTSADNAKVSSVTLDITYSSLTIGQSIVLTPTIEFKDTEKNYSPEIKWMNSDASVVSLGAMNSDYSVSVEAVGSGSATVSIMAGYRMASCIINVPASSTPSTDEGGGSSDAEDPTAFTVRLNFSSRSVGVGQSFTLVATTSQEATISWNSDNTAVATVNNEGVVTGVAVGTTNITASAFGVSAKCVVTVQDDSSSGSDDEDDDFDCTIYFFIDYNNVKPNDTTGNFLLAKFKWYTDRPISESGKVPANPTAALDPAFPNFIGWSSHTVIDTKDDLWDMQNDVVGNTYYLYLYGIWSDVESMTK